MQHMALGLAFRMLYSGAAEVLLTFWSPARSVVEISLQYVNLNRERQVMPLDTTFRASLSLLFAMSIDTCYRKKNG